MSLYSSLSTHGVRALFASASAIRGVVLVAHITMWRAMPSWMPLAWDLPNAAWAVLYAASAAVFAWLLWLGMKNHGSAERGAKRVLKQVAALGAVAAVAILAFPAVARAEVLVPGREMVAAAFVREGSSALDLTRYLSVDPDPEQLRAAAATVRPRAFPSRFRDARGAKVGRPLRGATRTPTN